ncbi:MAG TPA: HD domain-containing phosphohydrolase [Casimicrobiaceae bacterium]|nr:HD domain-containing phosphohydrolase [Casimicrobiaceae bacterium]
MSRPHGPAISGRAPVRPATDPHTLNTALRAWASAIDAVSDLVFMHDEGGCLMRVNRAYAARAGAPQGALLGRPFREVMPEVAGTGDPAGRAPAQCTPGESELVVASGESFSCRRQPLQDDSGGVSCCIHILRERVAAEVAPGPAAVVDSQGDDERLRRNLEATVDAFAAAIELNDPGNGSHGHRVAALAHAIGKELALSAEQLEGTRLAALIHDLGSFKIPVEVLVKPGKLTARERVLVQSHPEVAHRILQSIEFPWPIAEIILQHHERIDGTGYPRALLGPALLIEAKIIAVADAMEAMLSDRPYRPALGVEVAVNELIQHRGTAYDPAVVDACARLFTKQGFTLPE